MDQRQRRRALFNGGRAGVIMYLLFLDESGTPPTKFKAEGNYFVLGGVAIHAYSLKRIEFKFHSLLNKYKVTGEIKWKFFGSSPHKKEDSLAFLSQNLKDQLRLELFELISEHSIFYSVVLGGDFYKEQAHPTIASLFKEQIEPSVEDIYHHAYAEVFSQFNEFLKSNLSIGMINIDHRMNANDEKLRLKHHELMKKRSRIINSINFMPSHLSVGLQLADLIAGSFYRNYQSKDSYFMNKLLFNKKPLLMKEEGVYLSSGEQLPLFNALNALPN
jgi:hypothetical protein